jgi:ribosomal protein S18 acetylase RimI-like enzyme
MSKEQLTESLIEVWRFRHERSEDEVWSKIKDDILEVEKVCFGEFAETEKELEGEFTDPDNTVLLLRDSLQDKVVGYSYATPQAPDTAYIAATAILPQWQDRGYLPLLIGRMERELKGQGFQFIERMANAENGYADNIRKNYQGRIVKEVPRHHVYFKIKL